MKRIKIKGIFHTAAKPSPTGRDGKGLLPPQRNGMSKCAIQPTNFFHGLRNSSQYSGVR